MLAVDNPLRVGSPDLSQRETGHAEGNIAGELQALRRAVEVVTQREAALWRKVDALEAAAWPLEAPRAAVVVWQRLSDASGDVWYKSSARETAWELPPGAVILEPAAEEVPGGAAVASTPPVEKSFGEEGRSAARTSSRVASMSSSNPLIFASMRHRGPKEGVGAGAFEIGRAHV